MKIVTACFTLRFLLLLCICLPPTATAQDLTTFATDYYEAQYLDDNTVIVCGTRGLFSHSADAGETWEVTNTEFTSTVFWTLDFIDNRRGWAAGSGGLIVETNDGGRTWTQVRAAEGEDVIIHHLAMTASGVGVAVGRPGLMLRTTDFGQTWTAVGPELQVPLFRVEAFDDDNFVACGFGTVLYSGDGGGTWTDVEFEYDGNKSTLLWSASTADRDGNVYLSGFLGTPGFLLHTDDNGQNWNTVEIPGGCMTLVADNGNLVMASASNALHLSTDNGDTWTAAQLAEPLIEIPEFQVVVRGAVMRGNTALVFSQRNGILRSSDGGSNFTTRSFLPSNAMWTGTYEIDGNVYAAGALASFASSQDNGVTWLPDLDVAEELNFVVRDLVNFDNSTAICVGSRGTIARRSAEQPTWTQVLDDNSLGLSYAAVDVADADFGIAVGSDPTQFSVQGWVAAISNDAGQTWDSSPARRFGQLFVPSSVLSLGNDRWIVVGADRSTPANGQIALSTDNGQTWTYDGDLLDGQALHEVKQIAPDVLIAVGDGGLIVRSTDNGATWSRIESPTTTRLNSIDFASADLGIAVGLDAVLYSADGGLNWKQIASLGTGIAANQVVYNEWSSAFLFGQAFGIARIDIDATTDVEARIQQGSAIPRVWLRPIKPNPVNDIVRTAIYFRSSVPLSNVKVRVFSYMGAEVMDVTNAFVNNTPQQGFRHGEFSTAELGNGVYLLNLSDGEFNHTLRFVVMKR